MKHDVSGRSCAGQSRHQQGEGLVNAMRTVPPQFFTEEFSLTRCTTCYILLHAQDNAATVHMSCPAMALHQPSHVPVTLNSPC